jgi:N-acetylmuramoyl-L-alanine amidase
MAASSVRSDPQLSTRELSKGAVARLTIGALLLGGWLFVWAASQTNTITPVGIVIHHSSVIPGSSIAERLPLNLARWDEFHKKRGFGAFYWGHTYHIGYHYYVIFPDGKVRQGRPEHCVGAHAKGFNSYLGIVLIGDFSLKDNRKGDKGPLEPTAEQMHSLTLLCQRLRDRYNIPVSRIVRHSDIGRTECPGDRFPYAEFLGRIH